MLCALINGQVMGAAGPLDGHAVLIEGGHVAAVCPASEVPANAARVDLHGRHLLPGFIDTQVNGGGGVLFNETPTLEGLKAIGRAHRRFGTTGYLPTLISDDFTVIRSAIQAVDAAIAEGAPGVLGIHIEGPFLNAARKGIHDETKFRTLDEEAFLILTSLKRGKTLVTLAPEMTDPGVIRRLVGAGVAVAAGHTNATYETTRQALGAGLTGFTHLFNAMSPLTSRKPGVVGAALEDQQSWCGIIVDGRHVAPATLRIALRAPPDRPLHAGDGRHAQRRRRVDVLQPAGAADHGAGRRLRRRARHPGGIAPRHGGGGPQRARPARPQPMRCVDHGERRAGGLPRPRRAVWAHRPRPARQPRGR